MATATSAEAAGKEASNGGSSGTPTRCRSTDGRRLYAGTRLRWLETRNFVRRCGHSLVAGWSVTALRNKSAMPTPLSQSTGVSSRALTTVTFKTLLLPRRQPSISRRVAGKSQTPLMVCPQTRQPRRRWLDCEEQENRWRSDWGTRLGKSATDKDWHRQEDMDFTRRHGTTPLLTRLATGQVALRRRGSGETQGASSPSTGRGGSPLEPTTFSSSCSARRRIRRSASTTSLEESVSDRGSGFRDSQLFTQRRRSGV